MPLQLSDGHVSQHHEFAVQKQMKGPPPGSVERAVKAKRAAAYKKQLQQKGKTAKVCAC